MLLNVLICWLVAITPVTYSLKARAQLYRAVLIWQLCFFYSGHDM